jgi:uncharacterized repeat protein (TIGR04052 family)
MNTITLRAAALAGIATAALAACGGGDSETAAAAQSVSLDFAAYSGGTPVQCGTEVAGLGSGAVAAQIKDFRFYVSNVKLVKADGSEVALTLGANDDWNLTAGGDSVTLIDLEDATGSCAGGTAATNSTLKGTVPAGSYVGVKMTMGVPFALNHSDFATATKPLDIQAMAWSWQSGRKFAKIEVTDPAGVPGTWAANTFNFHLGSTGCTGNPANGQTVSCVASNRMDFKFAAFDPSAQKVAVDVQALVAGTNITVNQAGAPGCMSGGTDPECLHVFEALAIDWKADGSGSGLPVNAGSAQTLFKTVAK